MPRRCGPKPIKTAVEFARRVKMRMDRTGQKALVYVVAGRAHTLFSGTMSYRLVLAAPRKRANVIGFVNELDALKCGHEFGV